MKHIEEIDKKAIRYIKEVIKLGGELNYGNGAHDYLIHTTQTLVNGFYNDEPNEWHEGKELAWKFGLMENVKIGYGAYFRVKISEKGLKVINNTQTISESKWIKINSEKDLPCNIHFKYHTEYWASAKGIVFKIYFYNSYGGKNYSISEHNADRVYKALKDKGVPVMGPFEELDAYMKITRPEPYLK